MVLSPVLYTVWSPPTWTAKCSSLALLRGSYMARLDAMPMNCKLFSALATRSAWLSTLPPSPGISSCCSDVNCNPLADENTWTSVSDGVHFWYLRRLFRMHSSYCWMVWFSGSPNLSFAYTSVRPRLTPCLRDRVSKKSRRALYTTRPAWVMGFVNPGKSRIMLVLMV